MCFTLLLFIGLSQAYEPYEDNQIYNPSFEIDGGWTGGSYTTAWARYGSRAYALGTGSGIFQSGLHIPENTFVEPCLSYIYYCGDDGAPYHHPCTFTAQVKIDGTNVFSISGSGNNLPSGTVRTRECGNSAYWRGTGDYPTIHNITIGPKVQGYYCGCTVYIDAVSFVVHEHIKPELVYVVPSGVYEGATLSINNTIANWVDGNPYTYTMGYTYGIENIGWYDSVNWTYGYYQVWADPDYNSAYFRDGYGDWRTLTLNQLEQKSLSRTMLFTYDYFEQTSDNTPDVFLSVRDPNLNILDYWVKRNAFTGYQSTWELTQTAHQECYGGDCTPPIYPAYGSNFTVSKCFRNDGGATHTYHIRTRIGNETLGWCNEACIRDGKGLYVNETMNPSDIHCISRVFTPPVWADPTEYYDVRWEVYDDNFELIKAWTHEDVWQPSGVAPPPPFAYAHAYSVNSTWVRVGDHLAITGYIFNNGTYGQTFTLGMSIGKWTVPAGVYTSTQSWTLEPCNVDCYVDDLGNWTYKYIPSGESVSFTRVLEIPSYFPVGTGIDVAIGVWNITEPYDEVGLVSWTVFKNISEVVVIPPPPPPPVGIDADIVNWDFSDREPLIDDGVTVKIWIRNTGNVSYNFPVGLSIGNESNLIFCNRDCYTDGKGDYVYTGTIYPDETVFVQRTFKFIPEYFNVHDYYDVRIGVYHVPYIAYDDALDTQSLSNYIYISAIEDKLDAYAISGRAIPYMASRKGLVTIESYIKNAGSITWNYTLGMSIGLFDANDGQVYRTQRPELLPPCNTYCYVDCEEYEDELCVYPQWRFVWIPPNYTVPFQRKFRIPDYFVPNASFDVAIGVWSKPPEEGGELVSIVYYKNISFVTHKLAPEIEYGERGKEYLDKGYAFMKAFVGWDIPTTNQIIWLFLTMIVTVVTAYYTRESGMGSATPSFLVFAIMLIAGAITKIGGSPFLPPWIPVVLIIVSGLAWAKFMGFIGK